MRALLQPAGGASPLAERDVDAALLREAYDRLPMSLAMTVVVTVVFAGFLWPHFPSNLALAWALTILAVVAVRTVQWLAFRRLAPANDALAPWRLHFLGGAVLAGAAWSFGPFLMMPAAGSAETALLVAALLSVCAVAVTTQATQHAAMLGFLAAAMVPMVVAVWRTGGGVERKLALVLVAGIVALVLVGRRSHLAMRSLIETRIRMHTVIAAEPECIKIVDAQGLLLHMNPAGLEMIEADSLEQVAGTPAIASVAPEYREAFARMHERVLAGETLQMEFETVGLKGGRRWLETRAAPMVDQGRKVVLAVTRDIDERKRTEEALRRSEQMLREAQSIAGIGSYVLDIATGRWQSSTELDRMFGIGKDYGRTVEGWLDLVHPEDRPRMVAHFGEEVLARRRPFDATYRIVRRSDGAERWLHGLGKLTLDQDGRPLTLLGSIQDITERRQAEEKLHLAASVFTHAREGILITDPSGTILDVNDTFSHITGYHRDDVIGRNPRVLRSDRQDPEFFAAMWRELLANGHWSGELWNRRKDGELFAELLTISAVRDALGQTRQYVGLFSDITASKEHESQLEHIAHFDSLTGLPNRSLLADRMQQAMAQAHRRGLPLAVVYLDLDGFKNVNDLHGHGTGDQLLVRLATRMKHVLREGDTFSRLGGDEFVAVLLDLPDVQASTPTLARLLAAVAEPVQVGDLSLQVSASLGVTFYPQAEEVDADQLLRQADQAMYQAKLAGKNRYHVFDAEQDRSIRGHHESVGRIRQALADREFVLLYQPKVNMRTGAVVGAEALIRWQHPAKGLLPPSAFLPAVESHPLAIDIGEWVIDAALAQMADWKAAGREVPVSVNVGARQLQLAGFPDRLRAILAAHPGVRPGDLELEVLETSALEDMIGVTRVIEACREIGVKFALDDFGTGYSSLAYLKRLPVNLLKIDQSFVRDMLDDPDDLTILAGVIGLAASFRRQTIAEGVETVEHGEMLLRLGCELAQGYGIAPPMPAADFAVWSDRWRPEPTWVGCATASREELPLLFASVEHRGWVKAAEEHLRGERDRPPPLDHHQCNFGRWLDTEGRSRYGKRSAFQAMEFLHRQVHDLVSEMNRLHNRGLQREALDRVTDLHRLRDDLLGQFRDLENDVLKPAMHAASAEQAAPPR